MSSDFTPLDPGDEKAEADAVIAAEALRQHLADRPRAGADRNLETEGRGPALVRLDPKAFALALECLGLPLAEMNNTASRHNETTPVGLEVASDHLRIVIEDRGVVFWIRLPADINLGERANFAVIGQFGVLGRIAKVAKQQAKDTGKFLYFDVVKDDDTYVLEVRFGTATLRIPILLGRIPPEIPDASVKAEAQSAVDGHYLARALGFAGNFASANPRADVDDRAIWVRDGQAKAGQNAGAGVVTAQSLTGVTTCLDRSTAGHVARVLRRMARGVTWGVYGAIHSFTEGPFGVAYKPLSAGNRNFHAPFHLPARLQRFLGTHQWFVDLSLDLAVATAFRDQSPLNLKFVANEVMTHLHARGSGSHTDAFANFTHTLQTSGGYEGVRSQVEGETCDDPPVEFQVDLSNFVQTLGLLTPNGANIAIRDNSKNGIMTIESMVDEVTYQVALAYLTPPEETKRRRPHRSSTPPVVADPNR